MRRARWLKAITLSVFLLATQLAPAPLLAQTTSPDDIVVSKPLIPLTTPQSRIDIARIRQHVYKLASPNMRGRDVGSKEGARAVAWIEHEFKAYGLEPWFAGSYRQHITTGEGTNIAAFLRGSDPTLRDDFVLVSAHHDHLGVREGHIYPGADDNISAVALMLETARILAKHPQSVKRSILFVSFDAEEKPEGGTDKMGSIFFINQLSQVEHQKIVLMIGMDLMAGEVIPGFPGSLIIMGSEKSQHLSRLIQERTPIDGLNPLPLGLAMVEAVPFCPWCTRAVSDYDSFRQANIPFVFLSTGRSQYYHTPEDTPASLHYDKLKRNAEYLLDLTLGAANDLAKIDDYDHDARDQNTDISGVATLLEGLLRQPPVGILPETLKRLQRDHTAVAEFAGRLDPLSWFQYRKLQNISLRIQCAAARPKLKLCRWL